MTSTAPQRPVLREAREMIEALGGSSETARILGITTDHARITVNQWKARGVPWTFRAKLVHVLAEAGFDVAPDFLEPPGEH